MGTTEKSKMMKPDFKTKQQQKNKIPHPTQVSQNLAAPAGPPPIPSAYLRKKHPAPPAPLLLKLGSNRLLAPCSKKLVVPLLQTELTSNQAANIMSPTTNRELATYRSENKKLTEGLMLPDAQISVDKLLAQWADKIEKAEYDFELEEMSFERARERLNARNGRKLLRAMPQSRTSTALVESAGRMVRHSQGMSSLNKTRPPK